MSSVTVIDCTCKKCTQKDRCKTKKKQKQTTKKIISRNLQCAPALRIVGRIVGG